MGAVVEQDDEIDAEYVELDTIPTPLWQMSKVLLVGCAVAGLVAVWFGSQPVVNPGVQDCGAPVAFMVRNTPDTVIPFATADAPPDSGRLRAQPPCSQLVAVELTRTGIATGAAVVLGLLGVVVGLVDDRLALRRAPRLEHLLRPRPDAAPQRLFDPVPTSASELGARRLPGIELGELIALVAALPVAGAALWWVVAPDGSLGEALGTIGAPAWVAAGIVAVGGRAAAGWTRTRVIGAGDFATNLWGAVAAGFVARLRPEVGTAGLDVYRAVRLGMSASTAAPRVRLLVTAAAVTHGVVVMAAGLAVAIGARPTGSFPTDRWWYLTAGVAVVVVIGSSRLRRQLRAMAVVPDRTALREVVRFTDPQRTSAALGGAVVQLAGEVAVLWILVEAVGAQVALGALVGIWAVVVLVGNVGSFAAAGAGTVEVLLAVALVLAGVEPLAAVAVALGMRLVTFWAPLGVGALAQLAGRFRRLAVVSGAT